MNQQYHLFQKADQRVLDHIEKRVNRKAPSFLSPLNMLSTENTQVAYMFNAVLNKFSIERSRYHSFFCNSHLEALHGAIKLARHFLRNDKKNVYDGRVLIYDADSYYRDYLNQWNEPQTNKLIQGIFTIADFDLFKTAIKESNTLIAVCSTAILPADEYLSFLAFCRANGVVTILDISRMQSLTKEEVTRSLINQFDIVTWGEMFTNFEIPFGAISAKSEIYKVWNNIFHCSTHSSTFGGNGMVLAYVRDSMQGIFPVFNSLPEYERTLERIATSVRFRQHICRRYLNAFTTAQFLSTSPHFYFVSADGSFLGLSGKSQKHLKLDCVGGSGCNALGHNRSDLLLKTLKTHNNSTDYLNLLNQRITDLTGLERLLQGVSGASAVEMGITLALSAKPQKKKVLIFKGNFAGKTLVSLIATSGNHDFFKPLYNEIMEFDLQHPAAVEHLQRILTSGEIALVWMEAIQGRSLKPVEERFMHTVASFKANYKYLVGVDEVLNGVYRTGDFLSFDNKLLNADIITFAKAFSGMVVPVSFTAVAENVYRDALRNSGNLIRKLESMYVNQLTAHIAFDFLNAIELENVQAKVKQNVVTLVNAFPRIVAQSPLLAGVDAFGLHLRINLSMNRFPFKFFGHERSNAILTHVFLTKADMLCLFGRLLPPLNIGNEEVDHMLKGFSKVFSCRPLYFFWIGLKQWQARRWLIFKANMFIKYPWMSFVR